MDAPVTLILAVILPWICAGLVNTYSTILSMISLLTLLIVIIITYISPIFFYATCMRQGRDFETNFRLSLKQMYDGDRLSRKETSILPKTYNVDSGDTAAGYASTVAGFTDLQSFQAQPYNMKGTVKCAAYPTTVLLQQS